MHTLTTPVSRLSRVGATTAKRLEYLGIFTISDLLHHFPFRYESFTAVAHIADIRSQGLYTAAGTVTRIENRKSKNKRLSITDVVVEDESGSLSAVWFNQPFLTKQIHEGDRILLSGKVEISYGSLQFISPSFEKLYDNVQITQGDFIVPVYSVTGNISQKQIRSLIAQAGECIDAMEDLLPQNVIQRYALMSIQDAYRHIHFPVSLQEVSEARRRIKFDELFLLQTKSQIAKQKHSMNTAPALAFREQEIRNLVAGLPFKLTDDQRRAAWSICTDIGTTRPMNRLLEGDVGSGKTVVAGIALYATALEGYQGLLMAPTELLALQHYRTISDILKDTDVAVVLLTNSYAYSNGSLSDKRQVLADIASGKAAIVIGTHALIQESVSYHAVGLVIVDEQHRFGVAQRKGLKEKIEGAHVPHYLSMTATPIPRSLALIMYGELDVSLLKEMPKGRKPILTRLIEPGKRNEAYAFVRTEIEKGGQLFVVCPLIDPSDALGVKSVTSEFKKLSKEIFPELNIGLLHGKLKSSDKDEVLESFRDRKIHILVATSVVEVGVDVPNASIMLIEGADRFGLAQLHQFRGRVGRGERQSYCLLFTDSDAMSVQERLQALAKSQDGFELAEYDLQLRGPGEVYGTRQSGIPNLQLATLADVSLIEETKEAAEQLLRDDSLEKYPLLLRALKELELSDHLE